MKKAISMLLSACILASVPASGASARYNATDFLVAQSYNEQTSDAVPGDGAVTTGSLKVKVTKEGADKACEMSMSNADSSIFYGVTSASNTLSLFGDILYGEDWSHTEFYIQNSANKTFTLAYIGEDGGFYSADARYCGSVSKNKEASIQLTYDKKLKKLFAYVNGKCVISDRFLGSGAYDEVVGFGIKVKGKPDASCLVDNFAVFEGTKLIKSADVPQKAFLASSATQGEAIPGNEAELSEDFVGDTVIVNRSFDEEDVPELESITLHVTENKIAMDKGVFDGNKYLRLEKKNAVESFIAFPGSQSARYLVIETDFSTEKSTPAGKLLFTRDGNSSPMFCTFLNVATNGNVTTTDGKYVCKIEPLKWVKIALALNMNDYVMDIYVDGKLVYGDVPLANKNLTGAPLIRINCDKKANTGTLLVDNIKVYEGKAPRSLDNATRTKKVPSNSVAQGYLGGNKAIHPYVSTYYTDKTKYSAKNEMILENDDTVIYAHEEDIKAIFGADVRLVSPHSQKAGYYSVLDTAKENAYTWQSMDTRLYIFSKTSVNLSEGKLKEIQRYMFNVRPGAEKLLELFNAHGAGKHPRVMINEADLERIKSLYKTDPLMQEWGKAVIERADEIFGEDDYTYPITGGSMDQVNYAIDDIAALGLAYHLTGNERYVGRAWRFLKVICELGNWNPGGYLDVGELSFIVGLGYDWLYHQFTPEQRKYLEEILYEKGVHLTDRLYYGELDGKMYIGNDGKNTEYYTGWWDSENNWNAVCNGGTLCGAVAIMDVYPEIAASMIDSVSRAMEYVMPTYYPEGAWPEGGGYWRYALGYVVRAIMTMRNAFGTDFNFSKAPGLDGTGWYGTYLAGSTGMYTLGDTSGGFINNWHIMWLAKEYKDKTLMAMRMNEFEKFGLEPTPYEMVYYDPELLEGAPNPPLDTFMDGMEIIALREAWYDTGSTFVGASGGSSKRGHGHMDIGSFQIDMAGERFIVESGAENYEAVGGYFTKNRYYFYRSRPEGHNMYVINPENDNIDYFGIVPESSAQGELVVSKPRGAIGRMDLSEAYATWASSAHRGYMLSDDRRSVTVRDEIDLIQPNSEVYYSLHTSAEIEMIDDNKAVLTKNGKKMLVTIETNGSNVSFGEAEAATLSTVTKDFVKDTNSATVGLRKLLLKVTGNGRLNITAKFKQYDDMMVADEPVSGDISTWTIPDGEVTTLPEVDAIYIDGTLVKGFEPKITGYKYLVASKETEVPTVTVDTNHKYEIIPASEIGGDTIVKVYADGTDDVYRAYRINFWKKKPLADIDGMRRYPVASITASEVPQEQNGPDNVIDMSFGTRWAAQCSDVVLSQWICLELDDVYPVEKIGVSWMSGSSRKYTYKLEVSTDGENWTTVFDGASTGETDKCEYTQLGGKEVRFVRYTGAGNTANGWNSITEIEVLGNQR